LRELFQFDCAELDFGIYRIMNYKRDVIEQFIAEGLPKAVSDELEKGILADQAQAARELKDVTEQIKEALGMDALDPKGNLAEAFHNTPLGRKYQGLRIRVGIWRDREALEAAIFNHLYAFFSRYYQDGDFISKRRYTRRQRYAIPYNGEEVYLYWANHDQYYVKTGEHFQDYTYKGPNGVTIHFKLQTADVEQNNVKGNKRFFLPRLQSIIWDDQSGQLTIPFEYRPLTDQEEGIYGATNQQEGIIAGALAEIPNYLSPKTAAEAVTALLTESRRTAEGKPVSFFEHHLRQYTRRNTSDFFIHKDLKGFLLRELDFYLKNEVLNLDEMEASGEDRSEGWFQIMRVIRSVGGHLIDFLDQIENFQKMLWEKLKFIIETQYCIIVGEIDEAFYPEIAACEDQWNEWKRLFHIDEGASNLFNAGKDKKGKRVAFLEAHPTLVLDTRHFSQEFVDRLLTEFCDLDDRINGLLIYSENFQALNFLNEKYRHRIDCVYIDPPYNTGNDGFPYKDGYQHASWAAMMENRLVAAYPLMSVEAAQFVSLDDNEQHVFRFIADNVLGSHNFIGTVIWQKVYSPKSSARHFSDDHDYILVHAKNAEHWQPELLPRTEEMEARYTNVDNDPRGPWKPGDLSARNPYSAGRYKIICPSGRVIPGPPPGTYWRYSEENFKAMDKDSRIWWGENGENVPAIKRFLSEVKPGRVPQTIWPYKEVGHTQAAKKEIIALVPLPEDEVVFQTPKPTALLRRVVSLTTGDEKEQWAMDYFAGSGTAGHAVINLNREDGGRRKFILVEMAHYFDTVLLPRIKKVIFSPEWKDGKPKRMATQEEAERSPRIVKYIRLESYEDALNNIEFDDASGQQALKFEDYLLKYMLTWETKRSETLLNVEKLSRPFSYKLHIHADGETRERVADVPETFNYLMGLHVQTRKVVDDRGRRYLIYRGQTREGRAVAVIWRETEGWDKADLERDKGFVAEQKLTDGADEVFVNGDSFIPNARALEPLFKARMFGPVEA